MAVIIVAKNLEVTLLLDFYGDMLTENQRNFLGYYYNDDLSLSEIAARVSLSKERFAALYRKFFASSPYADVMGARIILAKGMLISGNASLKEIATRCGWRDEHYFSRCFRAKCGISPGAYRRTPGKIT